MEGKREGTNEGLMKETKDNNTTTKKETRRKKDEKGRKAHAIMEKEDNESKEKATKENK